MNSNPTKYEVFQVFTAKQSFRIEIEGEGNTEGTARRLAKLIHRIKGKITHAFKIGHAYYQDGVLMAENTSWSGVTGTVFMEWVDYHTARKMVDPIPLDRKVA